MGPWKRMVQSGAQRQWNGYELKQITNVFNGDKECILLETSHVLDVSNEELKKIYDKYFKPKQKFIEKLSIIPKINYCVHIRRGDFLKYFPDANESEEQIVNFLRDNILKKVI